MRKYYKIMEHSKVALQQGIQMNPKFKILFQDNSAVEFVISIKTQLGLF